VPGLANVAPALVTGFPQAATRGDGAACARIQTEMEALAEVHAHGHWRPALKAACALVGIGTGTPAPPLAPATAAARTATGAVLVRHGLLADPALGPRGRPQPSRPLNRVGRAPGHGVPR
jgi:dihydrodipicolinate synthase/N-acetylneuraminate lyase